MDEPVEVPAKKRARPKQKFPRPVMLEHFARGVVRGVEPKQASREAGYSKSRCNKGRVEDRLKTEAYLKMEQKVREEDARTLTEVEPIIHKLIEAAAKAGSLDSAAGYSAMRGLLAEAARLQLRVDISLLLPPSPPEPEMTREEWLAEYGPKRETNL